MTINIDFMWLRDNAEHSLACCGGNYSWPMQKPQKGRWWRKRSQLCHKIIGSCCSHSVNEWEMSPSTPMRRLFVSSIPVIIYDQRMWIQVRINSINAPAYHGPRHRGSLLLTWSNHINYKRWNEIIHPFLKIDKTAIEVWELICNFITHFTGHVIA